MVRSRPEVRIFRRAGRLAPPKADANVVIDVLRAFTTAHVALECGVPRIILAASLDEARAMKKTRPELILVGERDGFPVEGFDFGNSPTALLEADLKNRELVLCTTNGTASVYEALDARFVLAAGFVNARATAEFLARQDGVATVNVIGSSDDDDDFACAEFIAGLLDESKHPALTPRQVADRIRGSGAARKFLRGEHDCFPVADLGLASRESAAGMPLVVTKESNSNPILMRAK